MALDPDDPRPPYVQVANALRAAILTKTFQPGDRLPSRNELAKRYNVAPMTVQNALRELRDEGLIVSRQGSGVFVRERTERPVGLRPHLERAFEQPRITVDFAGFSGETLHGVIQEPLDKIRIGRLTPESIAVRLLLPDTTQPMAVPCRTDGTDSPEFRARATEIQRRHTTAILDSVEELGRLGLVPEVTAEVRVHRATPLFKLYLINNEEAFFGFYPVREHVLSLGGPEPEPIYDLMGKDAILFHHSTTDDDTSTGSQYVDQARTWFDSMWTTISRVSLGTSAENDL